MLLITALQGGCGRFQTYNLNDPAAFQGQNPLTVLSSPLPRHPVPPHVTPDLFKYRLVNCRLINSTFLHNKEGCLLSDVSDENNAYMVYFVSFLGTLAVLPGNIVSALLMDKIGRLRMLGNGPHHSGPCEQEGSGMGVRRVQTKVQQKSFTLHIKLVSDGLFYHLQLVKSDLKREKGQTV